MTARSVRPHAKGFTLIEMIVVVLIVSILASAAMPLMSLHKRRAQETELHDNLRTIRRAIDAYKQAYDDGRIENKVGASGYPPTLMTLVDGVKDIKSAQGGTIYFLRRLPRDPFAPADSPADATWGVRSYASPPDQPAPGEDVYDVYSTSAGTALDGSSFRSW